MLKMKIILLNWQNGENDPFTYFNRSLQEKLAINGRVAEIINLDKNFDFNISNTIRSGVDFAITWQGIASGIINKKTGKNLWEEFQIPLFCLHGDHPCHKIENHMTISKYVHHFYLAPSFCQYANQFIQRKTAAKFLQLPNIFQKKEGAQQVFYGDYFVFPKNHDDTIEMTKNWSKNLPEAIAKNFINISEAIRNEYTTGNTKNHHAIIESFFDENSLHQLKNFYGDKNDFATRNRVHATLDKFYRNYAAEHTLLSLKDTPIKIYGRGWERFQAIKNHRHEFFSFEKSAQGDFQFQSNYGILDIAPIQDSIHDRTLRAITNNNGFLIASSWNCSEFLGKEYFNHFFNGKPNQIRALVENVIQSPDDHRHSALEFKKAYDRSFGFHSFLKFFELLATPNKYK